MGHRHPLRLRLLRLDDGDAHSKTLIDANGGDIRISGGSISLQSESHPVEYRKVEIKLLKD